MEGIKRLIREVVAFFKEIVKLINELLLKTLIIVVICHLALMGLYIASGALKSGGWVIIALWLPFLIWVSYAGIIKEIQRDRKRQKREPRVQPVEKIVPRGKILEDLEGIDTLWSRLQRPVAFLAVVGVIIFGFALLSVREHPHPTGAILRTGIGYIVVFGLGVLAYWLRWCADMKSYRNGPKS